LGQHYAFWTASCSPVSARQSYRMMGRLRWFGQFLHRTAHAGMFLSLLRSALKSRTLTWTSKAGAHTSSSPSHEFMLLTLVLYSHFLQLNHLCDKALLVFGKGTPVSNSLPVTSADVPANNTRGRKCC